MSASLCWGAHAPRVLVLAPSPKQSFAFVCTDKFMPVRAPASAREGACAPRNAADCAQPAAQSRIQDGEIK
jgi:hypothetical protein